MQSAGGGLKWRFWREDVMDIHKKWKTTEKGLVIFGNGWYRWFGMNKFEQ